MGGVKQFTPSQSIETNKDRQSKQATATLQKKAEKASATQDRQSKQVAAAFDRAKTASAAQDTQHRQSVEELRQQREPNTAPVVPCGSAGSLQKTLFEYGSTESGET